MATQGYTTGGQGVLVIAPVSITKTAITLKEAVDIATIASINDIKYDGTCPLELTVFSSRPDEVGIVSTTPAFDAAPKTITFVMDRDDTFSMRFMQRYCKSLRPGLETPSSTSSTTAKQYEDGLSVRGEAETTESISASDTVFFAWLGPNLKDGNGGTKIVFGLAGVSSPSPNFSTAFATDNQFSFTLTGAPQESLDFTIPATGAGSLAEYVFNSAVGANFGMVGGDDGLQDGFILDEADVRKPITDGKIGFVFGDYVFKVPAKTSIIEDKI